MFPRYKFRITVVCHENHENYFAFNKAKFASTAKINLCTSISLFPFKTVNQKINISNNMNHSNEQIFTFSKIYLNYSSEFDMTNIFIKKFIERNILVRN